MHARFGRTVPKGFLSFFSVDTELEAEQLLVLLTSRGLNGEHIVRELAVEQTLPRLYGLGHKCAIVYEAMRESGFLERLRKEGA